MDTLAWAETMRTWRGHKRHRCAISPLPGGTVKLSSAEPNFSDISTVAARIRTLAGPSPALRVAGQTLVSEIPRPIVLLLPDASVRTVVLHLETLPPRAEEREALIRWRFGQEQLFPLTNATIVSQVLPTRDANGLPAQTVLAVAIQESVLGQYESLCEEAGLVPREIGLTSLHLFELWLRRSRASMWQDRDLFWLTLADGALTMMMFERGRLRFYRCKLLPGELAQQVGLRETTAKIVEECRMSLEACQQRHPAYSAQNALLCVEGEAAGLQQGLTNELGLSVTHVGWDMFESLGWRTKGTQRSLPALSAMAGLV
jgi:hypothetical protein